MCLDLYKKPSNRLVCGMLTIDESRVGSLYFGYRCWLNVGKLMIDGIDQHLTLNLISIPIYGQRTMEMTDTC